MYGICELTLIPVRKKPSDKSEMTNQLLFGDIFTIVEINKNWCKIISNHDNYEGWIDKKQINHISIDEYDRIINSNKMCIDTPVTELWNNSHKTLVVMGSLIYGCENGSFNFGSNSYIINTLPATIKNNIDGKAIIEKAKSYLGSPYLWGGRSPFGIDCSGLVQIVFRCCGIDLKRDASQQSKNGTTINFVEETLPGDLAFFDNEEGVITHVGIMLNNKQIIHASGKVRIDNIDHEGIYDNAEKKYTHKLRIIKRQQINNE